MVPAFSSAHIRPFAVRAQRVGGARRVQSAAELEHDLELIRESLVQNGGARLAHTLVEPLLLKVRHFGFKLHTLDVRQHRNVHTSVLAEIREKSSGSTDALARSLTDESHELMDTMRAVAEQKTLTVAT